MSAPDGSQEASSHCPQLPAEIWAMVIENIPLDHSLSTWLDFRRVSPMFRRATEIAFQNSQVREVDVVGMYCMTDDEEDDWTPDEEHLKYRLRYAFSGFSEDKERIVLRQYTRGNGGITLQEGVDWMLRAAEWWLSPRRSLEDIPDWTIEAVSLLPNPTEWANPLLSAVCSTHVITLGGIARDTELPGLQISAERGEMSFLWKPMLDLLFQEEAYKNKLLAADHGCEREWPKSKCGHPTLTKLELSVLEEKRDETELLLRRMRFDKWCRRHNLDFSAVPSVDRGSRANFETAYENLVQVRTEYGLEPTYNKEDWNYFWDDWDEFEYETRPEGYRVRCSSYLTPSTSEKIVRWGSGGRDGSESQPGEGECCPYQRYYPDGYVSERYHSKYREWVWFLLQHRKREAAPPRRG